MTKLFRLIHINLVLLKYGLDNLVWSINHRTINLFLIFFPWRWFSKKERPTGESIRLALEELGPIFVKFGQMLSTRQDLLPEDIALELAKLQDKVPPFPGEMAQAMIEASFKKPIHDLFQSFSLTPLASASISQVHEATLPNSKIVVVKVLRPKVLEQVKRDIGLLESFARTLQKVPHFKRFKPMAVVEEIKATLLDELDLMKEAANASQLRRNFQDQKILYVPEVYWDYCKHNVLVLEKIEGIRISDIEHLNAHQVNLKILAERGVEIFFTQVFRDCFFHADMHPGNIFVDPKAPQMPRYIAVDFGIMGSLTPLDQRYLAENFLAFFTRDYRKVARLHIESGWVPKDTPLNAFESAIRTVCEPIFEKPLKEISFAQTLLRLFQVARRFNMEVQPQLLLLQKTLLSVEGLGRQLYPDLDLWATAHPFLKNWMKQQLSPKKFLREIRYKLPHWIHEFTEIPEAIHDILRQGQQYAQQLNLMPQNKHSERKMITLKSISYLSVGCTLLLAATLIGLYSAPETLLKAWGPFAAVVTAGFGWWLIKKRSL